MLFDFNYTATVRRFAARFPALSHVGIQITFWVIVNNLMALLIYLYSNFISAVFSLHAQYELTWVFVLLTLLGILYGAVLGTTDYYLDKYTFRKMSLGRVMLAKALISFTMTLLILAILTAISFERIIPYLVSADHALILVKQQSWRYIVYFFVIFYLLMTLLISFINLVNKKYGPGVLVPLWFGKYKNPIEEERVFMFMDLKSSTTIAELLGHLRYSAFIRDAFYDINQLLSSYNVEIYQYVGDEMVLTWRVNNDMRYERCVLFFFACQRQFLKRLAYYKEKYGFFPEFKASLHMGMVTAVEIGDIKRDIAYHGDTINTTARIQSVCNQYHKELLVSEYLAERTGLAKHFKTQSIGQISLKGKREQIGIVSIEKMEDTPDANR
ncbi:adenylate/guanylate cyclase domain-containing protein [Parapedobacter koreensis]|uniref:Adenylate cyclase n=1 Tax=Parapedobacter koreensis TaxID=332977 RepID=A0A1H7MJJ3_9SPHI|nr:adenylate/guanylate cyclase domain-containing protein [Parapedobacter koreensis]SEL10845.1 adenylate cyclase [Parapedobacter koreensis]